MHEQLAEPLQRLSYEAVENRRGAHTTLSELSFRATVTQAEYDELLVKEDGVAYLIVDRDYRRVPIIPKAA